MANVSLIYLITTPFGTIDLDTVPDSLANKIRSGVRRNGGRGLKFDMRYKVSREAEAAMREVDAIAEARFREQSNG